MILLGSTGSIGKNTLEIAKQFNIKIEALSAGKNISVLNQQIKEFSPSKVAIANQDDLKKLKANGAKVFIGQEGVNEMISISESSLVINAIVGFAGLAPSLTTLKYNKSLALANKESLVNAGWLIDTSKIIPIDSEHFGLWYLYDNNKSIQNLIITASGGAFRDMDSSLIPSQTPQNALKHPNWKMGKKITIDSASMVNKLFELLEARWLFNTDKIDAYIERSSSIHALIEFIDGSTTAHFAFPDMKLPIAYALDQIQAKKTPIVQTLKLQDLQNIKFEKIDVKKYPLWELKEELLKYPKLGLILNASNEIAVEKFLNYEINFGKITSLVIQSIQKFQNSLSSLNSIEDIFRLDKEVRIFCQKL